MDFSVRNMADVLSLTGGVGPAEQVERSSGAAWQSPNSETVRSQVLSLRQSYPG